MNTTINEVNGELVAVFSGRLDTAAAVQTERDVQPLSNCDGKDIVLDCRALEYISSSGLRVLLTAEQKMEDCGGKMKLIHVNETVMEIFEVTGFSEILTIE